MAMDKYYHKVMQLLLLIFFQIYFLINALKFCKNMLFFQLQCLFSIFHSLLFLKFNDKTSRGVNNFPSVTKVYYRESWKLSCGKQLGSLTSILKYSMGIYFNMT